MKLLWISGFRDLYPSESSCRLLSLPQEDLPECLNAARHLSVGTLGSNSCVIAAVNLLCFALCVCVCMMCVCVLVYKYYLACVVHSLRCVHIQENCYALNKNGKLINKSSHHKDVLLIHKIIYRYQLNLRIIGKSSLNYVF